MMQTTIKSQKAVGSSKSHSGRDLAGLTPRFFLLPHVFHLIGERYQVVPDEYRERPQKTILEYDRFSGVILRADCDPDLGRQSFDREFG